MSDVQTLENTVFTTILQQSKSKTKLYKSSFHLPNMLRKLKVSVENLSPYRSKELLNDKKKETICHYVAEHVFISIKVFLNNSGRIFADKKTRGAFFINELSVSLATAYISKDPNMNNMSKVKSYIKEGIINDVLYKNKFNSFVEDYNIASKKNTSMPLHSKKLQYFIDILSRKESEKAGAKLEFMPAKGFNARSDVYYFNEQAALECARVKAVKLRNPFDVVNSLPEDVDVKDKENPPTKPVKVVKKIPEKKETFFGVLIADKESTIFGSDDYQPWNNWKKRMDSVISLLKTNGVEISDSIGCKSDDEIKLTMQPNITTENFYLQKEKSKFIYEIRKGIAYTVNKVSSVQPIITSKEIAYCMRQIFHDQLSILDNGFNGENNNSDNFVFTVPSLISVFLANEDVLFGEIDVFNNILKYDINMNKLSSFYDTKKRKLHLPLMGNDLAFFKDVNSSIDFVYQSYIGAK